MVNKFYTTITVSKLFIVPFKNTPSLTFKLFLFNNNRVLSDTHKYKPVKVSLKYGAYKKI